MSFVLCQNVHLEIKHFWLACLQRVLTDDQLAHSEPVYVFLNQNLEILTKDKKSDGDTRKPKTFTTLFKR